MSSVLKIHIGIACLASVAAAVVSGCESGPATEVEIARRQLRDNSDSAEAHFALGRAYANDKQHNDAYIHFRRASELDPNSFEAAYQLARTCLLLEDAKRGEKQIAHALRINPQSAAAIELRGRIRMMAGNVTAAVADFRKAIEMDPELTIAQLNLIAPYKAAGDKQAALQAAATAVELTPDQAATHFAYGDVLELNGRADEAEQQYRTAIELQDDFAPAKLRLAMLLARQKRHLQEARELAKAAQHLAPGDGLAEAVAAGILILMGEESEGLMELQNAAQSHPFNQTIWNRFAQALRDAGYEEEAEQAKAIARWLTPRPPRRRAGPP